MQDSLSALLIVAFSAGALLLVASRYKQEQVPLMGLSLAAHVVAGVTQVMLTFRLYGGGDIFGYARKGEEIAAALRMDFQSVGVELLKVLFQQQGVLPVSIAGIGSSTGSMTAIAALISFFTGGGVYTGCILLGVSAFFGKLAIFEVFRQHYPTHLHRRLLIATLLVPSVVFWSSGLLKESVAMAGLGPTMLGMHKLLTRLSVSGALLVLVGATVIALVKPYILFAFVLAAGAWVYAVLASSRRMPLLRPVHLVFGIAVATLGITLLSRIFPQYALDALAEQAALQQEMGQRARGGSTYQLIGEGADAGVAVQLAYAPLALLTSLYRPLLIEASNPQILVNALETSALLVMTATVLWRGRLRTIWRTALASPVAIFSVTFVIMFGVAVGLATTNLGTLSRYRMPLVPFFAVVLVLLLDATKTSTVPSKLHPSHRAGLPLGRRTSFPIRPHSR